MCVLMTVVVRLNFSIVLRAVVEGWLSSLGGTVEVKQSGLGVVTVDSSGEDWTEW